MKKNVFLFALLPFYVFSQISVTDANLPNIGDTVIMAEDNGSFSSGNSGANQIWDFSSANGSVDMLLGFIDPAPTPYQSFFPNSNIAVKDGSTFYYLNRSVGGIQMLGVVDSGMVFPWEQVLLPSPLNYLDTLRYTSISGQIDTVFSPSIPSIYLDIAGPYLVDSITVMFGFLDEFIVDSWGQVQMPNATYDALRIFQSKYEMESYLVRVTDTISGQSQWIQPPSDLFWEESKYSWRTADSLVTWSLVEMETDSAGNPDGSISYYLGSSINNIVVSPAFVDILKLEDVSCYGEDDGYIMLDIWGTALPFIFSWTGPNGFSSSSQDVFNLAPGIYEVTVTDANGNITVETYMIAEPSELTATINQLGMVLDVAAAGGIPPYSFYWDTGDTLQTISISSNGVYTCTVSDKLDCIVEAVITVTNAPSNILDEKPEKSLINIVDIMGRERCFIKDGILFYIYDDGTIEKKLFIE